MRRNAPREAAVLSRAQPRQAAAQARWIVAMEPWRGLGYREATLARWLGRSARDAQVWVVRGGRGPRARVDGVVVLQAPFLLGTFVALLAVQSDAAGQGLGRALMGQAEALTFPTRRWLYTSCDAHNDQARRFYRRQGFRVVGRLPDLITAGATELLLRKERPAVQD